MCAIDTTSGQDAPPTRLLSQTPYADVALVCSENQGLLVERITPIGMMGATTVMRTRFSLISRAEIFQAISKLLLTVPLLATL